MDDKLSEEQVGEVLDVLDKAITDGPWDSSKFLTFIGDNLRDLRQQFVRKLEGENLEKLAQSAPRKVQGSVRPSGNKDIFVALYSAEGGNLLAWERVLSNLPKQAITRPIYEHEQDVKDAIRAKTNVANEAYAVVKVHDQDVLEGVREKGAFDKLGKPLLMLKNNSIQLENIHRFVYLSSTYIYSDGRLSKEAE